MVRWVVAAALVDKCGGDSLKEMQRNFEGFIEEQRLRVEGMERHQEEHSQVGIGGAGAAGI
jgi:hypothetical protein